MTAPSMLQVAEQQGRYLAKQLNRAAKAQKAGQEVPKCEPFKYHHLGSMALVGESLSNAPSQHPCSSTCLSEMGHFPACMSKEAHLESYIPHNFDA